MLQGLSRPPLGLEFLEDLFHAFEDAVEITDGLQPQVLPPPLEFSLSVLRMVSAPRSATPPPLAPAPVQIFISDLFKGPGAVFVR